MRRENAEAIGKTLGTVEDVDVSATRDCRGKCFCRGRMVNIGGPQPQWVSFQYERMPIFCYWCGVLNHDEKDCKLWLNSKGSLRRKEQQYRVWMRATMERFYKSQLVTYHGGSQNATVDTPPQRTTQSLRITELVDCRAHTAATASGTLNDPGKKNPINVEEIIQPGPSNTEILNNQALFQTHLEEIDRDLGTLPTVTGEVSIETMHGKDGLNTDTNSSQVEEVVVTKTAGRVQNRSVTDSSVPIQDAPGVKGQMHTLGTCKRVTNKTSPMDTRESSGAKPGPK